MATKTDDKKLYKKTRAEYLELKQQFEILQESFGKALDKIAELERKLAKALKKNPELERELAKALKKISELERELAQHDNTHTPSSKKAIAQKAKPGLVRNSAPSCLCASPAAFSPAVLWCVSGFVASTP